MKTRLPGTWPVLLGCFVAQMGLGCGYVFSATLKHVVADFAWSRAAYAAGGIPLLLAMGLSAPLAGALSERIGTRSVVAGAALLLGGALLVLSRMESLLEFYLASALLGLGMTGVGDVVIGALASRWVSEGRGLVLGIVFVGSNLGGAAVPVLAEQAAATASWRAAFVVIAVIAVALILPVALILLREPPADASADAAPGSGAPERSLDLSQALRTRSFWILAGALLAFYFYYLGVNQHLVAFVSDLGYSDARAAASLGLAVLLGIVAKIAMGLAADRIPTKLALILNFALVCCGSLLVLAAASPPLLLGFLVIHGFAVAAENVVLPLMVAECFGVGHLARIYGALMITLFLGGALGPIFAGAIFDRMGSYQMAFGTFALVNLLSLVALLGLRREVGPAPRRAAASLAPPAKKPG